MSAVSLEAGPLSPARGAVRVIIVNGVAPVRPGSMVCGVT